MEHKEDIKQYSGAYYGDINNVKVGNDIDLWVDVEEKITVEVKEDINLIRMYSKKMVYVRGIIK